MADPHVDGPRAQGRVRLDGPHLFDLDGVLTDSASAHSRAWAQLFDEVLASDVASRLGVVDTGPFDAVHDYRAHVDGRPRRDGVVAFLAARGAPVDELAADGAHAELVDELAARKDGYFHAAVDAGAVVVFPDALPYLRAVTGAGLGCAVVSSSRNARLVLERTDLDRWIDVVVDGWSLERDGLAGKPAPDSFLHAAELLGAAPSRCVVLEDATVGVAAGHAGGFGHVVGVDRGGQADALRDAGADLVVAELTDLLG